MNKIEYLVKMRKYLAMIALTALASSSNAITSFATKIPIEQENDDDHQFFKESAFYQNRYLLNKSDWDAVFAKENYTEEEIKNFVLKRTDLSEEQKQDIIEHLHKEF